MFFELCENIIIRSQCGAGAAGIGPRPKGVPGLGGCKGEGVINCRHLVASFVIIKYHLSNHFRAAFTTRI